MPDEIDQTRNRLIRSLKLTALEYAAIITAALSNLIAAFALLFGGVSAYIAADAKQAANEARNQNKVYEIYINELTAWLKAHGLEIPLPKEPEDERGEVQDGD